VASVYCCKRVLLHIGVCFMHGAQELAHMRKFTAKQYISLFLPSLSLSHSLSLSLSLSPLSLPPSLPPCLFVWLLFPIVFITFGCIGFFGCPSLDKTYLVRLNGASWMVPLGESFFLLQLLPWLVIKSPCGSNSAMKTIGDGRGQRVAQILARPKVKSQVWTHYF